MAQTQSNTENKKQQMQNVQCLWNIQEIGAYEFNPGEYITSSRFFTTEPFKFDWKFRLYPQGKSSEEPNLACITITLTNAHGKKCINARASFSIVNSLQQVIKRLVECAPGPHSTNCSEWTMVKEDRQFRWLTHEGTLSILCELDLSLPDDEKAFKMPDIQRLMSTSVIKHDFKAVSGIVSPMQKPFVVPFGHTFVMVNLRIISDESKAFFSLANDPEIKHIWCKLEFIAEGDFTEKFDWKLDRSEREVIIPTAPYGYRGVSIDRVELRISINFIAFAQKDCIAYDFTTSANRMKADLQNLFIQPKFGDVSICADGKTLRAHKDLLVARSPVFAAMFSHNMVESTTSTVTIIDVSYATMNAVLKYIYYGMFEQDGVDVVELLKAADKFDLAGLQHDCERALCDSIDKDNCMNLLMLSHQYSAPMLTNSVISYVQNASYMQYD